MTDQFNGWGNQQIPYSQEAEEAVIGAVIVNPNAYIAIASFLKPDDFFILRHKYIWQAFQRMEETGTAIDALTVTHTLKEMGLLPEVGGSVYLTQLVNNTPTSLHAEVYGQIVERAAVRRRMMAASDEIKAAALNEEMTLEEVIDSSHKKLFEASELASENEILPFHYYVNQEFDKIENLMNNPQSLIGLSTGFDQLDKITLGLNKGDLYYLGGRPGMGKSSLALSIVMNVFKANADARIAYFPLEMPSSQITQRAIAQEAGINLQTVRNGQMTAAEYKRFVAKSGEIAKYNLFLEDKTPLTPALLEARLLKIMMGYGKLDLVVVDYVQRMSGGVFSPDKRTQELGYISTQLKSMAMTFDLPMLVLASLSRAVEQRQNKRPVMSDLRESGDLESDADLVMFVYRDEIYNEATEFPNQAEIIIDKHRNGPTGTVSLYFEKTIAKFMNAAERSIDLSHI